MILGYLIIGMTAGFVAFFAALITGATIWSALLLYSLVGSLGTIAVPLVRLALGSLADEAERSVSEEAFGSVVPSPSSEPSSGDLSSDEIDEPIWSTEVGDGFAAPMRILAVDDDPSILELIPMISATAGFFDVTPVTAGEHALERLASAEQDYTCLLLDINMPDMDGIELCMRVRQIPAYRDTPIIMLTAMRDMKYMDRAFQAGATDYLTKPFDIADFSARLQFAQEAVMAQRRSAAVAGTDGKGRVDDTPYQSIVLFDDIRIKGVEGLADYSALSNYLTQLPRDQLADTHVVAIRIDQIANIYKNSSAELFICILRDVAEAVKSALNIKLMAFTEKGVLLAVSKAGQASHSTMEQDVHNALNCIFRQNGHADFLPIDVSIGDPVTPIATKVQRSKITCDRAITRADNRYLQKFDRFMVG